MYLTFKEYQVFGGKLSELEFNRAEFVARMKIDFMTTNRLRDESPVREVVKRLVFELIERGFCGALDGKEAKSMSEGSLSASFESSKGKAEELIHFFLFNEGLIAQSGISFAKVKRV